MRFRLLLVVACALAACSPDEGSTLEATAQRLSDIRSGDLTLEVTIGSADGEATSGFTLEGPFSLPEETGELPAADLTYVQIAGSEEGGGRFIATGESVYTEIDGQVYELPEDQVESFRATGQEDAESVFTGIDINRWLVQPTTQEGEDTVTITGDLDVVAALNDISTIAQRFGGAGLGSIEGEEADRVEEAVRSASITVESGSEDGLLRRLSVAIDFGVENQDLTEALGPFAGAAFKLEMTIESPNEPIEVEEPTDALPLEELVPTP